MIGSTRALGIGCGDRKREWQSKEGGAIERGCGRFPILGRPWPSLLLRLCAQLVLKQAITVHWSRTGPARLEAGQSASLASKPAGRSAGFETG